MALQSGNGKHCKNELAELVFGLLKDSGGAEQVVPFADELLLIELPYCFCLNNFRVCC